MTQHKWHKEIKAWADGTEIEYRYGLELRWLSISNPDWNGNIYEFRIKPQPKHPKYLYVYLNSEGYYELDVERRDRSWIGKIEVQDD